MATPLSVCTQVPAWGASYSLADEFANMTSDHPVSAFIQNADDSTAPPQGTLAYAQKLLALKVKDAPSIHISNKVQCAASLGIDFCAISHAISHGVFSSSTHTSRAT